MKSDVETLNPTRVKLTVAVSYAELKPSVDAAYKSLAGQVQVPGFRRGKVPPRVIDQRFGRAAVIQEAVNEALPRLYQQAVAEASVHPMGQPEVDVTDFPTGSASDADELRFTAEVDVRPTIELPDYSEISVTVDAATVTDADVDAELEALRVRFSSLLPAERPITGGDVVTLDLVAEVDGEQVDSTDGISYEVGSGSALDGLDDALLGASAGEAVTFTAPLASGEHEGEVAQVTATVGSVKIRELPDVDDDFAELASEFDSLADLKADLRLRAEREKVFAQGMTARDKVLDALIEKVDVPVPESLIDAEVHQHLENESRLDDDAHRAEVDEQTRTVLRQQILLDAIVDAENISVSQEEIVEYLVLQAPRYGVDPNTLAQAMSETGQVAAMFGEVARRKALAVVLAQATVTDTDGEVVDFSAEDVDADELDEGVELVGVEDDPVLDSTDEASADTSAGSAERTSEVGADGVAVTPDEGAAPVKPAARRSRAAAKS